MSKKCCVYLHSLGKMSELKKLHNEFIDHDDDFELYKLGTTSDEKSRRQQHINNFKKHGLAVTNICITDVHETSLFDAENELKKYFKKMK